MKNILNHVLMFLYYLQKQFYSDKKMIQELEKIPRMMWADIYSDFNSGRFPLCLSHIKPGWWPKRDTHRGAYRKGIFCNAICLHIVRTNGSRAISWNHNKLKMTLTEFNVFWEKYGKELEENNATPYRYMAVVHSGRYYREAWRSEDMPLWWWLMIIFTSI